MKSPTSLLFDEGHGVGNDLDVRRVVTGHDAHGKAVVMFDDLCPRTAFGVQAWSTDRPVADNNDDYDGARRRMDIVSSGGSVVRVMRIPAGTHSYMHRTQSLDYGILLEGRLDLHLDDGVIVELKAGDVVIQRGTIHAWVNPYEAPCTIAFILLPAAPVLANGQPLAPTHR